MLRRYERIERWVEMTREEFEEEAKQLDDWPQFMQRNYRTALRRKKEIAELRWKRRLNEINPEMAKAVERHRNATVRETGLRARRSAQRGT